VFVKVILKMVHLYRDGVFLWRQCVCTGGQ